MSLALPHSCHPVVIRECQDSKLTPSSSYYHAAEFAMFMRVR
jgi:hypothetical protein